jgi:anaerobic selenocysteine-containing dehydrogenase
MATATKRTFCRFCHANCAMLADIEDGRVTAVRGDPEDVMFGGYTCIKGRQLAEAHNHAARLRACQQRSASGFESVATDAALDAVAERLRVIIDRYGPKSVAVYCGTYAFQNSAALAIAAGFLGGIGSHQFYTSVTLDQPAKVYTTLRMGQWGAGVQGFETADVALFVGNNPLVSHYAPPGGLLPFSPSRRLRDALDRGLKLVVIDPRESDVARLAHVHLQVTPGEDVPLLAAMLNVILSEALDDGAFVQAHVDDIGAFRAAVAAFTPDAVAGRCGVPAAQIITAARLFANGKRGAAVTGTGPEMSGRGTLVEWLVMAMNIVCGRFAREGEPVPVPRVFTSAGPRRAAVSPPTQVWGEGFPASRFRSLTALGQEMPCNVLADEILTPGEGQVRALINVGGNPVNAFPNQAKICRALDDLELLVSIDVRLSNSAKRSHFVLAPSMSLERDDITNLSEWWYDRPYARYTRALVDPPAGLIDEWEMFWELAQRLGTPIPTAGGPLPMDVRPDKTAVLDMISAGCLVAPSQVKADSAADGAARVYDSVMPVVEAADATDDTRFCLLPGTTASELAAIAGEDACKDFGFRLISRRTKHRFNSTGHDIPALRAKRTTNFANMHPADLAALGVVDGDLVDIAGKHGRIVGVARGDPAIKQGVVSMAHGYGDPDAAAGDSARTGASTNRLVDETTDYDPITGQSRQSAIPVNVSRSAEAVAAE